MKFGGISCIFGPPKDAEWLKAKREEDEEDRRTCHLYKRGANLRGANLGGSSHFSKPTYIEVQDT